VIDRDVYRSGQYAAMFQPDDSHNPFQKLYAAKRDDVISSIRRGLAPGGRVLDLGGGPGRMAVRLAGDYRVTLGDVSLDMLRTAEVSALERRVTLQTLQLDASKPLPLATHTFDRAICTDVLPHLAAPVPTLRELRRVLRPDGELLVDATNRSAWWLLAYPRAFGRRPERWVPTWRSGGIAPEWQATVRHHRHAEFLEMLIEAGFRVMQEWRYGPIWSAKWYLTRCRPAP
jgi:ubiquinone/menaquinone biosynthesis C-methylase UbiE